jgi:hypothetical protein
VPAVVNVTLKLDGSACRPLFHLSSARQREPLVVECVPDPDSHTHVTVSPTLIVCEAGLKVRLPPGATATVNVAADAGRWDKATIPRKTIARRGAAPDFIAGRACRESALERSILIFFS